MSEAEILPSNSEGVTLYKSKTGIEISIPKKPNIPLNEGLHIEVSGKHDQFDSPKEVLSRYLFALGSAKAVAESGLTRDAWANTRLEEGQKVSVYGRVPKEDASWRKPVDTLNRIDTGTDTLIPFYDQSKLTNLFKHYMPKWEQLRERMELFPGGVEGKDVKEELGDHDPVIWENDQFNVVAIKQAHLNGFHLVVNPKEGFARQWQTVKSSEEDQVFIRTTIEATAIALGIQNLLASGRGEIHNSGNWASDLKSTEDGGRVSFQKLEEQRKKEKKSHRPDIAEEDKKINTSMHAHVYIPDFPGPVILSSISLGEARQKKDIAEKQGLPTQEYESIIKQWEQTPQLTEEKLKMIQDKIGNGKLTNWLKDNCQGQLED
ncbi:hypothetical protein M1307_01690 [Patescibacteria group bacterium]|nr:hypothetical protein [Patescibacteria group bacterium]